MCLLAHAGHPRVKKKKKRLEKRVVEHTSSSSVFLTKENIRAAAQHPGCTRHQYPREPERQWLLEAALGQPQLRLSSSQRAQGGDFPRGPGPTVPHNRGSEHQDQQSRSQTNTEVQLDLVETTLPVGWGGGKAGTQNIMLGACSFSDVLPQGCQGQEKLSPSSSTGTGLSHPKQGGTMTRWELLWGRQPLQTRTIYWLLGHSSTATRAARLDQTQAEAGVYVDMWIQSAERGTGTQQPASVSEDTCRHQDEDERTLPEHWRTARTHPCWHKRVISGLGLLLICDRRCFMREEI